MLYVRWATGAGIPYPGEGLLVSTNEIEDQRLEIRNHCEKVVARGEIVPKARESFSSSSHEACLWECLGALEHETTPLGRFTFAKAGSLKTLSPRRQNQSKEYVSMHIAEVLGLYNVEGELVLHRKLSRTGVRPRII